MTLCALQIYLLTSFFCWQLFLIITDIITRSKHYITDRRYWLHVQELLRRIQTTQPSRDVSRDALLADYSRNRAYLDRGCYWVVPQAETGRRRHSNSEPRRHHYE